MSLEGLAPKRRNRARLALLVSRDWSQVSQILRQRFRGFAQACTDIVRCDPRDFVLVNSQPWHLGWDFESRRPLYMSATGAKTCVRINLFSALQVRLLSLRLASGSVGSPSSVEIDAWHRTAVDLSFWYRDDFPVDRMAYVSQLLRQARVRVPKTRDRVEGILSLSGCKGLMITQQSTDDWPWAFLAAKCNKRIFEPEGLLGSAVRSELSLDGDIRRLQRLQQMADPEEYRTAADDLERRTRGDYEGTSRANYMSKAHTSANDLLRIKGDDLPLAGVNRVTVFFAHQFGDTPNARVYDYSRCQYWDYFDMALDVIHQFENAGETLLVKLHPLTGSYRGDKKASASLLELIGQCEHVYLLPVDFNVGSLETLPNPVALTGRGSVAVECAYSGTPVAFLMDCWAARMGLGPVLEPDVSLPVQVECLRSQALDPWEAKRRAIAFEVSLKMSQDSGFYQLSDYCRQSVRNECVVRYAYM